MSLNKAVRYLVYSLILFGCLIIASSKLVELRHWVSVNYKPGPYWIASFFAYVIAGILLAIEYTYTEFKKPGRWKTNIEKLIFLGIPALFFSLMIFIYFAPFQKPHLVNALLSQLMSLGQNFIPIAGIFLGYILSTSFYKEDEKRADADNKKLIRIKKVE